MQRRSIVVFLLVGGIWGSEWVVTRGLDSPSLGALALRYAIAACLLGAVAVVRRIRLPGLRLGVISAITGVSFAAAPVLLIARASGRISPGLLVVILAMTPLIAALLEGRASGAVLASLVGGVGGIALLASQGLSFAATQWAGALAAFAAATLIAVSIVLMKRQLAEMPGPVLGGIQLAVGAVCVALASGLVELQSAFAWSWKSASVEVGLGILGSTVALQLYYWLLRRLESFQLTTSQWVATVVGVGESVLLVRATPSWRILAGIAITLASLWSLLALRPDDDAPLTIE
jgi:putative membrane protein PagO